MYRGGLHDDESFKYFGVYSFFLGSGRNIELAPIMAKKSGQDSVLTTGATSKQSMSILVLPNVPAH